MLSFDLQINSELTIKFQSELVLFPSATGREGEELWPLLYRKTLATAVMLSVKSFEYRLNQVEELAFPSWF